MGENAETGPFKKIELNISSDRVFYGLSDGS